LYLGAPFSWDPAKAPEFHFHFLIAPSELPQDFTRPTASSTRANSRYIRAPGAACLSFHLAGKQIRRAIDDSAQTNGAKNDRGRAD